MSEFDPTFDPLQALEEMHHNQLILQKNQTILQDQHNRSLTRIVELEAVCNVLIKGLEQANKNNERILGELAREIARHIPDTYNPNLQGQH